MSSIFEEIRANRANNAEIRRQDRIAKREQDRADRDQKEQQKRARADRRRAALGAAVTWVGTHPIELMLCVIVVVPAVLAWTAMSVYGGQVYGPIGWLLPAFSEAGMWAFAFAVHAARRAGKPTGWLQVGVWVFTAVSAVLNFTHGLAQGGFDKALVMATVAVGGVIAHQLITAAPMRQRRTRAERRAARTTRIAQRRITRMERAAVRTAVGELATDGTVRLLYRPGVVTLRRCWLGSRKLVPTAVPGLATSTVEDELDAELRALLDAASEPAGTAQTPAADPGAGTSESDPSIAEHVAVIRQAIRDGQLPSKPSRRRVQKLLNIRAETAQKIVSALRRDDGDAGVPAAA